MTLHVWQATIVDAAGNVLPGAEVTVREQSSANLVQLFEDREGDEALGNPVNADEDGFVRFYVLSGRYQITASLGESSRVWENVELGSEAEGDVRRFGAVGDGVTDDRTAIQAAINSHDRVYIPSGTYRLSTFIESDRGVDMPACLRFRSNSHIYGDGIGSTILKLMDDAHPVANLFEPADKEGGTVNWCIEDMTLDGNQQEIHPFGVTEAGPGPDAGRPASSCISTMSASYGTIRRVEAINAVLHCIDVCGGGEVWDNGGNMTRGYVAGPNAAFDYYPENMSRFVRVEECKASNPGDDPISTHYAEYVWIVGGEYGEGSNRHGDDPQDPDPDNLGTSNAIEIDDGSRKVWISNTYSYGCKSGIRVQGHGGVPSPAQVNISNALIEFCDGGVRLVNSNADDLDSARGRDFNVSNVIVRHPGSGLNLDTDEGLQALYIHRARDVNVTNYLAIADGDETENWLEGIILTTAARDVSLCNVHIENWNPDEDSEPLLSGVRLTNSVVDATINNLVIKNCGWRGFVAGGTRLNVTGLMITGKDTPITDSIGVRINPHPRTTDSNLTGVTVLGYDTSTSYGSEDSDDGQQNVQGDLSVSGKWGFNGATPIDRPVVTDLDSLITALDSGGLITDGR